VNKKKDKRKLTWDGQDITCKLIQVGKRSSAAQPPLNWIASVKILLREFKEFVNQHMRFPELSSKILLWRAVER
jgi:hypothetical protein